jgi:hypothetical protein
VVQPIELLASGRDARVAEAAGRALALIDEVKEADAAVRRPGSGEHTVVRGFTRRFYGALGGSIELTPADLEQIEDETDPTGPTGELLSEAELAGTAAPAPQPRREDSTAPRARTTLPRDR